VQDRPRANVLRWRHPVTLGRARQGRNLLCPQAQPLRTSRLDHDPGRLSSWTASLGGLRSPVASGRARPRPHARPQGQERHAIRLWGMKSVPYASSAVKARPRPTSSSRSAAGTIGFHHLIQRLGKAAKMPFSLHPHMLRHACGYKLANDGHDPSLAALSRPQEHPAQGPIH
jgi:hypothetical protein